jgi:hypothetical protein
MTNPIRNKSTVGMTLLPSVSTVLCADGTRDSGNVLEMAIYTGNCTPASTPHANPFGRIQRKPRRGFMTHESRASVSVNEIDRTTTSVDASRCW